MSYSIEQFILDSGITRAEVDEAKARMLERMHMYGLKETHNKKAHEKEELALRTHRNASSSENRIVASYSTSHNHRYTAHHYETILWSAR